MKFRFYLQVIFVGGCLFMVGCLASTGKDGDVQDTSEKEVANSLDGGSDLSDMETMAPDGSVGVGTVCEAHSDCASAGLQCMSMGKGSDEALCSAACATDADCPQGRCEVSMGGMAMCVPRKICEICGDDQDCALGTAPTCMPDPSGTGYCTAECNPTDPLCPGGYRCTHVSKDDSRFFCQRLGESCWGDGKQCSPCEADDECEDEHQCYGPTQKGEQFCAAECTTTDDCRRDFDCATEIGLCMRVVGDRLVATCLENTGGFCDSCSEQFECQSGLCYQHQESKVQHCSMPCEGQKDDDTCPNGTFCVQSSSSATGWACTPPQLYKCSGWLACIGVECAIGETCDEGWCVGPDAP